MFAKNVDRPTGSDARNCSSPRMRGIMRRGRCGSVAVSDTGKLIGAALGGLAAIWRDGCRYKKAGVVLLDLHPAAVARGCSMRWTTRAARADADDRSAQHPLRSRHCDLRRRWPRASLEIAPGVVVALLHDRVGRAATRLGSGARLDQNLTARGRKPRV